MNMINGKEYTIICRNVMVPYIGAPKTNTYKGYSLPSAKYDPPNTFRISTGIRDFPIRVVQSNTVLYINDVKVRYKPGNEKTTRLVNGSKGEVYTVMSENGRSSCSCVGYQYRGKCKHLGESNV